MIHPRNLVKLALFALVALSFALLGSNFRGGHAARAYSQPTTPAATLTVTTLADGGAGSLREAIVEANNTPGADTITFSVNGTINLESSLPSIGDNLTINGPGANLLTVRRNIGGAYRIFTINSGTTVILTGLTLTNGLQDNGGGILNSGTLTVNNCAIVGNNAPDGGGGILNRATLTMNGCTISGNTSTNGSTGGLWNLSAATPATATLTNCTISGNTTGAPSPTGSAIDNSADATSATVNLINCTIANNTATNNLDSGGLFSGKTALATLTLKNTIVAGNSNVQVRPEKGGVITSLGNNLIGDNSLTPAAGDLLNTNPLLATLGNYGGPTATYALLPGSPAINAGTNAGAPATDQRGITRPQQTTTDIGAFESRGFAVAVTSGNNQSTLRNTAFANPLVVTVSSANSEPVTGGRVTFTPPANGASATLSGNPATIQANGQASVTATANSTAGTYQVTAATNGGTNSAAFALTNTCTTITVNPTNPTLPTGRAGTPYNQTFTQTGGIGTVTFTVSAGALPTGLTITTSGVLSGTPSVNGTFNFTIRATDANNCFGEQSYTLTLNPPCTTITLNPTSLPNSFLGTAYNQTLTATGGGAPHTFTVTTGSLPNGLNLASGGALTGTPNTTGTFAFTVTATDNTGCIGTRNYTVTISGNGLQFYPLAAPVRLLDTRAGQTACSQPNSPIAGQSARTQPGRNVCGIPASAVALTGNITTVQSGGGFLTLYPSDATQPTVASVNYNPNETINNVFTVGLGADGAFKIFAFNTTDVVVDVTGYYAPPTTSGLFFHPLPKPIRLLETRTGQLGCATPGAPIQASDAGVLTQQARITCDGVTVPNAALAIVGNATTVNPQGGGFLTLFPGNTTRPLAASSNYGQGQIVNGPFSVALAPNGEFKIYTFATTDLVVDVLGYYSAEANDASGTGLLFSPLAKPVRLLETRTGQPIGCFKPGAPLNAQQEYTQTARGLCDGVTVPTNALGVVGNATVVQPSGPGFLTLWPSSTPTRPTVATANYSAGEVTNRHFIVGLGNVDGAFKIFSFATSNLVIDLSGYFAP